MYHLLNSSIRFLGFLVFIVLCTPHTSYGQSPAEELPPLIDWALSTGDWDSDPQLYVKELGTGAETIIMLHGGWGGTHDGLIDAIRGFESDYHFVFYEQRGSLRSPCPDSLISFDHHIEDLERLRIELKLDKLTIVGHSMGTILASAYAQKYPDRIKKLVLLAPAYLKNPIPEVDHPIMDEHQAAVAKFFARPEIEAELARYGLAGEKKQLSSKESSSRARISLGARMLSNVSNWKKMSGTKALYQGHVFGLTANTYPTDGWNYIQLFKERDFAVKIISGAHDFLDFENKLIRAWLTEVPEIEFTTIDNAGHVIWLDQPNPFADALRKALME